VHAVTICGATALHIASLHGHVGCVNELLEAGADTGARTNESITASDLAEQKGHTEVAALLKDWALIKSVTNAVAVATEQGLVLAQTEAASLAAPRVDATEAKVAVRAHEQLLSSADVTGGGMRPSRAALTAALDSSIEVFHDANEHFADASHALSKAERKAKRYPAAAADDGGDDLTSLRADAAGALRALQRAQRAVEGERAAVATLAAGPFPEVAASQCPHRGGGRTCLDPEQDKSENSSVGKGEGGDEGAPS